MTRCFVGLGLLLWLSYRGWSVVILVNLAMSLFVLRRLDTSFFAEERWGATSLSAVDGVRGVVVALFATIVTLIAMNYRRLPSVRASLDAGANASALPAFSVASFVASAP